MIELNLAYGLFGAGYVVTATFLVAIVRQAGAASSFEALIWMVTGLAVLPSLFLFTRLLRRVGPERAFAVGCLVNAAGVVASVMLGIVIGPMIGAVMMGVTLVSVTFLAMQCGHRIAPRSPRRLLAIMTMNFGIGQIVAPIIAGYLAESTGSYLAPSIMAALALVIAALLVYRHA